MLSEVEVRELLVVWKQLRNSLSGKSRISFFVDGYVEALEQVSVGGRL